MKDSPLQKAFEDAMAKIAEDPAQRNAARQLSVLQSIVQEFQAAEIPATLETRPADRGWPLTHGDDDEEDSEDEDTVANGTVKIGADALDFILQKDQYDDDEMTLKFYRGTNELFSLTSRYDSDAKTWADEFEEEDEDDSDDDGGSWRRNSKRKAPKAIREVLAEFLIGEKAGHDFAARFSVGPREDVSLDKPISIAAPLKLRRPEKP